MKRGLLLALALSGCAHLYEGGPPGDAPAVFVLARSACPNYRLTVRQDGTVQYDADRTASENGSRWTRVQPEVVAKVSAHHPAQQRTTTDIDRAVEDCRRFGAHGVAYFNAVSSGDGWIFTCDQDATVEKTLLDELGAAGWVTTREACTP